MFEQEEQRDELLEKIEDLISRKRYAELRDLLLPLEAQDIAGLFMELDDKVPMVFRLLPKEQAAEVFVELDSEEQEVLIQSFSNTELKEVLDELYLDDAVDIVEEMPANVVKRILRHADPDVRKSINEILKYPDDCAGSIMTTEYVDLKATMTVEDALKRIRRTGPDKETINICYVIDEGRHLLGYLSIRTILLSEEDDVVGDIMDTHVISANTLDDQEDVAQTLNKYDFLALPIVDTENRLVGIVTVDDAMDVLQEEVTEDIEKMAAILPGDKPYLKTGVFETWRARTPWLMMLMLSATFTGMILTHFENSLAAVPILTSYIPMLRHRRQQRHPGLHGGDPRPVAGGGPIQRSAARGVEGVPRGADLRCVPGGGQLCEDDGGGLLAAGQPHRNARRGGGGVLHPGGHGGLRQAGGRLPAHFGGEDRVRPGGDGLALHQHHRGRAVSADLLPVCNLDLRRINHLKRLRLLCKKRGAYSSSFSFITQFSAAYSKNIPINAFLV